VRIFISYSSKHQDICDRLQLALEADGRHKVFVDRSELTPGRPFDETLRKGIEDCDLLIFLISPESVAPGSYALAEMGIAKRRWRHPGGHVLPVKVAPTPKEAIPAYLRAVTILEPKGDVVAETVAAVDAIRPPSRRGRVLAMLAAVIVLASALAIAGFLQWQKQRADEAQVTALAAAARQLCESGDHALAWQRYDDAIAHYPNRQPLRHAREVCGMRWLREMHVREGKQTLTDIVNRVLPVLAEGAASASGQHAADLLAHMGWADFLRMREGAVGLDPQAHYRKALAVESSNVFAHAMWGHHIMVKHGAIDDAKQHFTAALASGRERPFVRALQFAAMLYYHEPAGQIEAARLANDMRKNGEAIDPDLRERLWTDVYYDGLSSRDRRKGFLSAMHDPDNAATFRWLYPENQVRPDRSKLWRFFMASFEDATGERAAARLRFESLRDDLERERLSGLMLEETISAIKRLQSP
jgi:tetratricopeptide (TPR) repeat protein